MKTKTNACVRQSAWQRLPALTAIALSATLPMDANAQEQTGDPYKDEVYVMPSFEVRGTFASSLAAAAQRKEFSPLVVEVLTAEDLGKLPDTSIAESLARLPGIATQRINGRAQIVSIRGLNEDFSSATLNGREQVTTGSVRAIEFDQYPAELMSGAVVYKTGDASIISQGIAGVVDLRTVRPLDYGRRVITVGSYYEWTEKEALLGGSERGGWRYNATYVDQFADDTIGIAVGYAYTDKMGQGEQWNTWGFADYTDPVTGETNKIMGGVKPFVRSSELERHGLMTTLEWKPSDNVRTSVDFYYTKFKENQNLGGIEFPLVVWGDGVLQPGYTVTDGVISAGTVTNVRGVMRNDIVERDADIYSLGWNLTFADLADWLVSLDLSYSKIERQDLVLETYSGTRASGPYARDTLDFQLTDEGAVFTSTIDYGNPTNVVLTSPQGWGGNVVPGGQLGYLKTPESEDEIQQGKILARRFMDYAWVFNSLEMGANVTKRSKFEYEKGYYLAGANGATEIEIPVATTVTSLDYIGIPSQVAYDPVAVLNSGVYERISNPNADVLAADWDVDETVTTYYAKAGIEQTVFSVPLEGSLGIQFVHADQSSSGKMATGSGADGSLVSEIVTGGTDYWDAVPSLNLTANLGGSRYLRFSASRQLARQRMDHMKAGTQFTFDGNLFNSTDVTNSPWGGNGGNPELEPWRSNSIDLSFEQYFSESRGYFAITGFYKHLLSYTYEKEVLTDFTSFRSAVTGDQPALWEGYVSRWENGAGGEIKGMEMTLSLAGEFVSDYLAGFGMILSGSYTDSSVSQSEGADTPLPGLSEKVGQATVYYERGGFSSRLSATHRSDYLATVSTFGPRSRTFRTAEAETVLDAQVSYSWDKGFLEGLTVTFQAYNITNEPLATYLDGSKLQVVDYQNYGRSYALGFSYRF